MTSVKEIHLTQGKKTIVDTDDYKELSNTKWLYSNGYARFCYWDKDEKKYKWLALHRVLMGNPKGLCVDHINGDTLDNRKSNLRIATKQQNNINVPKYRNKTSKYKGVNWHKTRKRWVANITINQKQKHLGYFESEEEAAFVYNEHASKNFGEFAYLNEIEGVKYYG